MVSKAEKDGPAYHRDGIGNDIDLPAPNEKGSGHVLPEPFLCHLALIEVLRRDHGVEHGDRQHGVGARG